MTLQEFAIEFALRHKELPDEDLVEKIAPFLETRKEEPPRLHIVKGCFLKLLNELSVSNAIILPVGFIICVTAVSYNKDKEELSFYYKFNIKGRPTAQNVYRHRFEPHPINVLSSIFELVNAKSCSTLVATINKNAGNEKRRKYIYTPEF